MALVDVALELAAPFSALRSATPEMAPLQV